MLCGWAGLLSGHDIKHHSSLTTQHSSLMNQKVIANLSSTVNRFFCWCRARSSSVVSCIAKLQSSQRKEIQSNVANRALPKLLKYPDCSFPSPVPKPRVRRLQLQAVAFPTEPALGLVPRYPLQKPPSKGLEGSADEGMGDEGLKVDGGFSFGKASRGLQGGLKRASSSEDFKGA